MYDIRNLNIWKQKDEIRGREVVLEDDVSKRKETFSSMKSKPIFEEIMRLVPEADIEGIKKRRGGKFRFLVYLNETANTTTIDALELSVRSSNCLHRAGYRTVGELLVKINGSEDLKKIRNCGAKSIDEIMEQLFCFQYKQFTGESKIKYIRKVLEMN